MLDSMEAPLHPATVHWPIAFLSASWALDIAFYLYPTLSNMLPSAVLTTLSPHVPHVPHFSFLLLSLGLLFALPAVATGAQQLIMMQSSGQSTDSAGNWKPKFKISLLHASLNDVVAVISAYNWWARKGNAGFMTDGQGVLGAVVCLPVLLYSASLGGKLVYQHGMGINLAKAGKEKSK